MRISPADEQLLSLLREDARAATADIARRLGLSRTTVQSRSARLEQQGVIAGYTVRTHADYEQGQVRAHVLITVLPRITTPTLTAQDVSQLDLVDLTALGGEVLGFFVSKADREAISPSPTA